jgi:hypothetical protein
MQDAWLAQHGHRIKLQLVWVFTLVVLLSPWYPPLSWLKDFGLRWPALPVLVMKFEGPEHFLVWCVLL